MLNEYGIPVLIVAPNRAMDAKAKRFAAERAKHRRLTRTYREQMKVAA